MTRTTHPPERATASTRVVAWLAAVALALGAALFMGVAQAAVVGAVISSSRPGADLDPTLGAAAPSTLTAVALLATGGALAWLTARRLDGRFDPVCTRNVGWVGGALAGVATTVTLLAEPLAGSSGVALAGITAIIAPVVAAAFAFAAVWWLRRAGRPIAHVLTRALVVAGILNLHEGGAFALYWFVCAARDEPMLPGGTPAATPSVA